jgi:Na+-translocating ferredoxin:NAD+ oxidoreductase RnfD subunit
VNSQITVAPSPALGNRLKKFVKTPKGYVLVALVLLTVVGGLFPQGMNGVTDALLAVTAALVFDALVARALGRKVTFSTGGAITGLIVADVLSGLTPVSVVLLTTIIALASKHVLKRGRKPLFNPAAVGLLLSLVLFSTAQSWWASMPFLPTWALGLFLAAGVLVAMRVDKYLQVLAFLGTYFTAMLLMALLHLGLPSATPADALRPPFINSALFLAFFMMTDPPTTPATTRGKIQFAVIAAVVSAVVFAKWGGLAYLLVGLLAGNLWTAWLTLPRSSAQPARRPAWVRWPAPLRAARAHPTLSALILGALVASGTLTAVFATHGGLAWPLIALGRSTAHRVLSGTWTGTVRAGGLPDGATVLELRGPWRVATLLLTLDGFSNGSQFVVQAGQVQLTMHAGTTWQGAVAPGKPGTFVATLTPVSGRRGTMHLTISMPRLVAGGHRFVATVSARGP